uniref:Uncharacterized protein n=1 Tax=Laticauda laticaudata TaxID=8630 RepID=A0A8C5RZY8_LATLA
MQEAQNGKEPKEEEELEGLEGVNEALIRKHQLPLSAQSAFSYVPSRHKDPPELSYFYQERKAGIVALYDCVFKRPIGYDAKLHRCDREHAKSRGLHINEEVIVKSQGDKNHDSPSFLLPHDSVQVLAAVNYCILQVCNGVL